jgi:hypothetical protein
MMKGKTEEKKVYEKPELRRVELSLAEITLGTGCNIGGGSPDESGVCGNPGDDCDTS